MKAFEQSFPVVLFITLYKVVISVSVFAKQKRKFEIFSIISVSVGSSSYEQPLTPSIILPSITIVSSELFSLDAILYIEENHSDPNERFHFLFKMQKQSGVLLNRGRPGTDTGNVTAPFFTKQKFFVSMTSTRD